MKNIKFHLKNNYPFYLLINLTKSTTSYYQLCFGLGSNKVCKTLLDLAFIFCGKFYGLRKTLMYLNVLWKCSMKYLTSSFQYAFLVLNNLF